jgi:predicted component of type VI protein secretion system
LIDDYNKLQRQRETDLRTPNENDVSIKEIDSRLKEDRVKINDVLKNIKKDLELKINASTSLNNRKSETEIRSEIGEMLRYHALFPQYKNIRFALF